MYRLHCVLKLSPLVITVLLGLLVVRSYVKPDVQVSADSGRFDYVHVATATFLYRGDQGVLLMDKRNGNIWFIGRNNTAGVLSFDEPVFLARIPLEKLDQAPR